MRAETAAYTTAAPPTPIMSPLNACEVLLPPLVLLLLLPPDLRRIGRLPDLLRCPSNSTLLLTPILLERSFTEWLFFFGSVLVVSLAADCSGS